MTKASTAKKPAAATSVFGAAPTIVINKAAPKSKTPEMLITGIQNVASLKAVIAALEAICVEETRSVKEQMESHFVTEGRRLKRRPENFAGKEGIGSASCQLRTNTSALSADGIELCAEHNVPTETEVKVAETFVINPAYANDSAFVAKMELLIGAQLFALQDERGSLIQKQEGVSKTKISDVGLSTIFTLPEDAVTALLPHAFTMAIRSKLETGGNLRPALDVVEGLLGSPLWTEVAKEAAANPEGLAKKTESAAKKSKKAA